MKSLAIVKDLDVIEDLGSGVGSGGEVEAVDQLQFEGAPEAFHGGIVITVAAATHGGEEAGLSECLTIIGTGVLDAAIRMAQEVGGRSAVEQSHVERA